MASTFAPGLTSQGCAASSKTKQPPWMIPFAAQQVLQVQPTTAQGILLRTKASMHNFHTLVCLFQGEALSHKHPTSAGRHLCKEAEGCLLQLPITTKLLFSGLETDNQLQQTLQEQLQARPIWTQAALAQRLPQVAQPDLESQLQKLCYQFNDGTAHSATAKACMCGCAFD